MNKNLNKIILGFMCLAFVFTIGLCSGTPFAYATGEQWALCGDSPLNNNITIEARNPSVVMIGDNVYVAWQEWLGGVRQIRVKMFNGSTWSYIDGGGTTGLNCDPAKDAYNPNLAVYNGELYLVWQESNTTTGSDLIHARKYNGFGSTWTDIDDQEGTNVIPLTKIVPCLNYITGAYAYTPVLTVYKGKLYASWTESNNSTIMQLHVSRYDGGKVWIPVGTITIPDGNNLVGLNCNAALSAYFPSLAADNDYLYVAWGEYNNSVGYELRVKKYDGTDWTSADGGTALSLQGSNPDLMVYKGELYITWHQPTSFGAAVNQIMMMKYNQSSSSWSYINPDPTVGLNYLSTQNTGLPDLTHNSNYMYISWQERAVTPTRNQIRVASYNGASRIFIDGNGGTGINYSTGNSTNNAEMACNDKFLYTSWEEYALYDATNKQYQVYVKRLSLPYTTTASATSATPNAGADNAISLMVLNSLGVTDPSFNGAKNVIISGCEAAANGSYGSFKGITLTGSSQTISVDFTNGVASSNLVLYKADPQTIDFSIEGVGTPATNSLTITPNKLTYTLTFSVTNGTNTIAGAQITISGQNITTDENGQASIALEDGDYTYSVTAAGYADVTTGSVTVNGAGANEAITMTPVYTVTFEDWNGDSLKTETVEQGKGATAPTDPTRDGYTFTGWDKTFDNITSDLTITAQYSADGTDECFIATAAFGSKLEPAVVLLRQFRDRVLLTNALGRAFVDFYYRNSPPIAAYIAGREPFKAFVRVLLLPFIAVAYLTMHPATGIGFIGVVIFIVLLKKCRIQGLGRV